MVRKHLHFSVAEWQTLPWWQQKMYVDQLAMDLAAERGEEPSEPPGFEETQQIDQAQGDSDAYLRGMGFNL